MTDTERLAALLKPEFNRSMLAESYGRWWSLDEAVARLVAAGVRVGDGAEARAALLAELEAGVEALIDPRHGGPPLADDLIERAAVLDLIRKAGK